MIFVTMIFILMSVRYLLRGNAFQDTLKLLAQAGIDQSKGKAVDLSELKSKTLVMIGVGLLTFTAKIIYLFFAYDIDPLKYPTLLMFVLYFGTIVTSKPDSGKPITEEAIAKAEYKLMHLPRWSTSIVIHVILWLAYLLYISYILIGGNL